MTFVLTAAHCKAGPCILTVNPPCWHVPWPVPASLCISLPVQEVTVEELAQAISVPGV